MNKIFKIVWNSSLQMFVVVSELAKGVIKSKLSSVKDHSLDENIAASQGLRKIPFSKSILTTMIFLSGIALGQTDPLSSFFTSYYSYDNNGNQLYSFTPYISDQNGPIVLTEATSGTTKITIGMTNSFTGTANIYTREFANYVIDYNILNPQNVDAVLTISGASNNGNMINIGKQGAPVSIMGDIILERKPQLDGTPRGLILNIAEGSEVTGTIFFGIKEYASSIVSANQAYTLNYNTFNIGPNVKVNKINMYLDNNYGKYTNNSYTVDSTAQINEIYINASTAAINKNNNLAGIRISGGGSNEVKKIFGERHYFVLLDSQANQYTFAQNQSYTGTSGAMVDTELRVADGIKNLIFTSDQNFTGGIITNDVGYGAATGQVGAVRANIIFSNTYDGDFVSKINGTATTTVTVTSGANVRFTNRTQQVFGGQLKIEDGATLTLNYARQAGQVGSQRSNTLINGRLILIDDALTNNNNTYRVLDYISGTGTLELRGEANSDVYSKTPYHFGTNSVSSFTGNLEITNLFFLVDPSSATNHNQYMVNKLNFIAGEGSWVQFKNNAYLKNIIIGGGTLDFTPLDIGSTAPPVNVNGSFSVDGSGQFAVNEMKNLVSMNLLDLSSTTSSQQLIKFAVAQFGTPDHPRTKEDFQKELDNITFVDKDGVAYKDSEALTDEIKDGSDDVGKVIYDYHAIATDPNSLEVVYKIIVVDAYINKVVKLGSNKEYVFDALIRGEGGISIDGTHGITLTGNNTFTGGLHLNAGTITAGGINSFGLGSLTLDTGTTADLNGKTQSLTTILGDGTFNLNGGTLTLTGHDDIAQNTINAVMTGSGELVVNGDMTLSGQQNTLTAEIFINENASLIEGSIGAFGNAPLITANGTLVLNKGTETFNYQVMGSTTGNIMINELPKFTFDSNQIKEYQGLISIIDSQATLTLKDADVNHRFLVNSTSPGLGQLTINSTQNANFSGTLEGNGLLNIDMNGQELILSGDHSKFTGNYTLNNSTVGISNAISLGSGAINLSNDSTVSLNYDLSNFDNVLTGDGNVIFTEGNITLGQGTLTNYQGTLVVNDNVILNMTTAVADKSYATINLKDIKSVLNITGNTNYIFTEKLEGIGRLNIDLGAKTHNFSASTLDTNFKGTVYLSNATTTLAETTNAEHTLANVTLGIGSNADVRVLDKKQKMTGLFLDGGILHFAREVPTDSTTAGTIESGTVYVSNKAGYVQVDFDDYQYNIPTENRHILDYDEGQQLAQLVVANKGATGALGNLILQDELGNPLGEKDLKEIPVIDQDGVKGSFNFKLVFGEKNDGIYLSYGLTQLDIAAGKTMTIDHAVGYNTDLSSKVTGAGNVLINANELVSFSNGNNDYTGSTKIESGGLRLDASNALGQTSLLELVNNASFDLNSNEQTIGGLMMSAGSSLDLNAGKLTIVGGGESSGTLIGGGEITLGANSKLGLSGNNQSLSADIILNEASKLELKNINAAGTARLDFQTNSTASVSYLGVSGVINNEFIGNGQILIASNENGQHSQMRLYNDNTTFTGIFHVDKNNSLTAMTSAQLGTATVNNDGKFIFEVNTDQNLINQFSGTGEFIKKGSKDLKLDKLFDYSGSMSIENGSLSLTNNGVLGSSNNLGITIQKYGTLKGQGSAQGNITNFGTIQVGQTMNTKMRAGASNSILTIEGNLTNSNIINIMENSVVGNTLIINGNYFGQDNAKIYMNATVNDDKQMSVDHLNISGSATGSSQVFVKDLRGLTNLIQDSSNVLLITTGTSTDSAFTLGNTVMSGAYEYRLKRDANDQNWYLTSSAEPIYRPDLGNSISNVTTSIQSVIPGLNDNRGLRSLSRFRDGQFDGKEFASSVWNTTSGSKSKGKTGNGQVHYDNEYYSTTFGGDHIFLVGDSAVQLGVMIGSMEAKSRSRSLVTGSVGKSKVTGETYGIYGSWYLDINNPLSSYVDGSIVYGKYTNKQKTKGNEDLSYRSHVWSYTLQGGYPIAIGNNLVIEPQAQITYLDYDADSYKDNGGTRISQSLKGNTIGRIGAFVYPMDGDIRPYAGINFWYDNTQASIWTDNYQTKSEKAGFMVQIKGGVNAQMSKNFSISLDADYRQGKHKNKNYGVGLTMKYIF